MLDTYIAESVKELTKRMKKPVTTKSNLIHDFPVASATLREVHFFDICFCNANFSASFYKRARRFGIIQENKVQTSIILKS